MTLVEETIPYGDHPLQVFKSFSIKPPSPNDLIPIFIHGGAWRDPNNTEQDADHLFRSLLNHPTISNLPISVAFSLNYRLSPEFKIYDQTLDVLLALKYITSKYSVENLVFIGHSAGAFLSLYLNIHLNLVSELRKPFKILSMIFSEGIYDIRTLIDEYPSYNFFVEDTFGTDKESWDKYSAISSKYKLTISNNNHEKYKADPDSNLNFDGEISILHSYSDELLSFNQTSILLNHLRKSGIKTNLYIDDFGKHDDVFKSDYLVKIVLSSIESLTERFIKNL